MVLRAPNNCGTTIQGHLVTSSLLVSLSLSLSLSVPAPSRSPEPGVVSNFEPGLFHCRINYGVAIIGQTKKPPFEVVKFPPRIIAHKWVGARLSGFAMALRSVSDRDRTKRRPLPATRKMELSLQTKSDISSKRLPKFMQRLPKIPGENV